MGDGQMNLPDFTAMTDAEFDAFWEARTEAAAEEAIRTGDDAAVEAVMLAHGEAFAARYPA
jgi:hypothetical protein